ncbi:Mu transposase C-terminal domain-containing protein [Cupriavidus oxalaticus]|uniref:Mu transposase C-terminal domain-containing protein n=1 Tax=Cupriavidus oxalaticus TaxID=96344 RepID=UPI003179BF3F
MKISKLSADILQGKLTVVRDADTPVTNVERGSTSSLMCTATLPDRYKSDLERKYAYVRHMRKIGLTKGQRTRIADAIETCANLLKDIRPPKVSTVMQWMRDYERSGENPTSLVSRNVKRRASPRLNRDLRRLIEKILTDYYFVKNGCSIRTAHDRVIRALSEESSTALPTMTDRGVSLSTVRRIILETSPFDRDRSRLGTAQARAKWRFSKPGRASTRPLERVEIDHTLADSYVIDDRFILPLGRPVITVIVCTYSGYILGFFISFEGETVGRLVQCIKIAIQPKDTITAGHSLSNAWHSVGGWETLCLDNGAAGHTQPFQHIAMDLGMDIEYCPVRMPWFKPSVERCLGELTRQLPPNGRPKKPGSSPDPFNPNEHACITFSDFCYGILKWVVDVHPFEINERKLARPIDLFLEGLDSCPPPTLIDNTTCLDVIAGIGTTAMVDHGGVVRQYLRYTSDELVALKSEVGAKFKANIKYDPYDLGRIFLQDPRTGHWITVGARDQEYTSGLTATQHKLIRNAAGKKLTLSNAETVLRKARLELQDHWANAIRAGKRLKKSSRDLALFQGLSSISRPIQPGSHAPMLVVTDDVPSAANAPIPSFEVFTGDKP